MIQKIIKIINKTIIYSIQTLIYISKSLSDNLDKSFLISLIKSARESLSVLISFCISHYILFK